MANKLLDTGDAFLLEHNNRHGKDSFWSDNCDGTGNNLLGLLLILRRDELKGQECWRRWLCQQVDLSTGDVAPDSFWQRLVQKGTERLLSAMPQLRFNAYTVSSSFPTSSSQLVPSVHSLKSCQGQTVGRNLAIVDKSRLFAARVSACGESPIYPRPEAPAAATMADKDYKSNILHFDSHFCGRNAALIVFSSHGVRDVATSAHFLGNCFNIAPMIGVVEVSNLRDGTAGAFRNAVAAYQALRFWLMKRSLESMDWTEAFKFSEDCSKSIKPNLAESGYTNPWDAQLAVLRGKFARPQLVDALLNTHGAFLLDVSGRPWFDDSDSAYPNVLGLQLMILREELSQQTGKFMLGERLRNDLKWQEDVTAATRTCSLFCRQVFRSV